MFSKLVAVERFLSSHSFVPARVQRQYIWTEKECETFHNDLIEAFKSGPDDDYYLGPMILATEGSKEVVQVYDGQQRITTLTIYLASIAQVSSSPIQNECLGLSRVTNRAGEVRPRIDLKTRGGALTRVVRNTKVGRNTTRNMPVDWRILDIEKMFLARLREVRDLDAFARWLQRHVMLNVLWAENEKGLTLFDRANNRGVRLQWYELAKSVITEALGSSFQAQPQKNVAQFWYETERETKYEFPDLISSTSFIRYGEFDSAPALAALEDEFSDQLEAEHLSVAGRDFFSKMAAYRKTSERFSNHHKYGSRVRSESDLIEFQLLSLEFPHWKPLLMFAEERGVKDRAKLALLKKLRNLSFRAHLLGWPSWRTRLKDMFGFALQNLKNRIAANKTIDVELLDFIPEQLAQARGVLSSTITDPSTYRPLVKLWESELAFKRGALDGNAHFLAHVEHILPQAPRGDWCIAFQDEDERAELRNKLGNFCLLSKDANYQLGNDQWVQKRKLYRKVPKCFVGAHNAANHSAWSPEVVRTRTQQMASEIGQIIGL